MADPGRVRRKSSWIAPNRMAIAAVATMTVAIVVALALIIPQHDSFEIQVLVANLYDDTVEIDIYVDDVLKRRMNIEPGGYQTIGEWPVSKGVHAVDVKYGWGDTTFTITYRHDFDTPSTKSVWIGLGDTIHVRW